MILPSIWKKRSGIPFDDKVHSVQGLSGSGQIVIVPRVHTIVDFVDWIGDHWGVLFLCSSIFPVCVVGTLGTLDTSLSKKKKKNLFYVANFGFIGGWVWLDWIKNFLILIIFSREMFCFFMFMLWQSFGLLYRWFITLHVILDKVLFLWIIISMCWKGVILLYNMGLQLYRWFCRYIKEDNKWKIQLEGS